MYGEDIKMAKAKVDRERKIAAKRHDMMLDRARTLATNKKNRETSVG